MTWIKARLESSNLELQVSEHEMRGNLVEVEEAIKAQADLNAFVFVTEDDELTLLHLAVLNEHHDSLQRLLQTGMVQANRSSGIKGCTALYLAAEHGKLDALVLLLEHFADVNTPADCGQSPLIVAAAHGHTKVAALLREHNANEDFEWMKLRGARSG
jgi:ankyrin repeat protein